MKKTNTKINKKISGFTLIELMVVITIIGILAIIVLPNLGSITGRGQDTAIKEQMVQFRVNAAEYYADNYGFTTGAQALPVNSVSCLSSAGAVNPALPSGSVFTTSDFVRVALGIKNNAGKTPNCYLGAGTTKSNTWAVVAAMRKGGFWCVDSVGDSKPLAAEAGVIDASNEAVCP